MDSGAAERLLAEVRELVRTLPDWNTSVQGGRIAPEAAHWLGRASATAESMGRLAESLALNMPSTALTHPMLRNSKAQEILQIVYRLLALAERAAPASAQGAFIPAATPFDALRAVGSVLEQATTDVLIVDPYFDATVLTDFALQVAAGVSLRLLSDEATVKASLKPAAERWSAQYGSNRPLEARLSPPRALHDRLIIIDGAHAWLLTQSFKDLAARSPASLQKADAEQASLKIAAYGSLWAAGTPL